MRFATLSLLDTATGNVVWQGSALQFVHDNSMERGEAVEMLTALRSGPGGSYGFGGGAAAESRICVAGEEDLIDFDDCDHEWVVSDEDDRCYCELCGADGDT